MKRFLCLLLSAAAALSLAACGAQKPAEAEIYAMDTVMDFTAYGDGAQSALDDAEAEIAALESLLSRTKEDSEVSRVNADPTAQTAVSPSVAQLLRAAADYSAATGGAFDITIAPVVSAWGFTTDTHQVPAQSALDALVPLVDYRQVRVFNRADGAGDCVTLGAGQSIDLGGIAKGFASDRVADIFARHDIKSGMISLGGNVYVCGAKPDGSDWRVGVRDPQNTDGYAGVLDLTDAFAVTSGGYQRYFEENGKRYHHIIDPATGYPAESGLLSVTVVADAQPGDGPGSGTMCDALSTALFVMGAERALDFWRTGGCDFDLVLITDDGRILVTDGIADRFTQGEGYSYEVIAKAAA